MAGNSSRFYSAGYSKPKFQLEIGGVSLFRLSLMSFQEYFEIETFLFVLNRKTNSMAFLENELRALKITHYEIVELESDTKGQADTVAIALGGRSVEEDEHLLIFNIDTIRPDFRYPDHFPNFPWIETFIAEGDHWSFVEPFQNSDNVVNVAEKHRISKFCSTGMYFFPSIREFLDIFHQYETTSINMELYVAPLYQLIIDQNRTVKHSTIESNEIFLGGTPSEFLALDPQALFEALKL
jgi:hypothetical protein